MDLLFEVTLKVCSGYLKRQTVPKNMERVSFVPCAFSLALILRTVCTAFDGSLKLIRY